MGRKRKKKEQEAGEKEGGGEGTSKLADEHRFTNEFREDLMLLCV